MMNGRRKRSFRVKINFDRCKGCGICVAFCPKGVLVMARGKSSVKNQTACIGCVKCEMLCPDFAIQVERDD